MEMSSHQLSYEHAMRVVSEWRDRVSAVSCYCCFTYQIDEFAPTCGAIIVWMNPFSGAKESARRFLDLRAALEVWHAVSCCRGFGFHENLSFWEKALQMEFSARQVPLAVKVVFPLVLVHWRRMDEFARPLELDSNKVRSQLRAFFRTLGAESTGTLDAHRETMAAISPFVDASRIKETPIRVKVRLRLDVGQIGCQPFPASLKRELQDIHARLLSVQPGTDIEARVILSGLVLDVWSPYPFSRWRWLGVFLRSMPRDLPIELASYPFASNSAMDHRAIAPFLEAAIGRVNGQQGRLEVLHLREVENLGALCSLLPHSHSLREVRLQVNSSLDWLWLTYAMFHPASRQTKWSRLCLRVKHLTEVDLQVVRRFRRCWNGHAIFSRMVTASELTLDDYPEPTEPAASFVMVVAVVATDAPVYALNKTMTQRHRLTTLQVGTPVELAETNATDLPEFAHVIVPGFGLGVVQSACLSQITEQVFAGPRTSCITALHLVRRMGSARLEQMFLEEVTSSLRHIRVSPPVAFLEQPNSPVELIQMIDGYEFSSYSLEWMQRTTQLHSLGLTCTPNQVTQLASALRTAFANCTHSGRVPLRVLRLFIRCWRAGFFESTLSEWVSGLQLLVETVTIKMRTVRSVDIAIWESARYPTQEYDAVLTRMPSSQPDVVVCKLTFLGILRSCGLALDSYMISHIFAFYGPSLERAVVLRKCFQRSCFSTEPMDDNIFT